MATSYARTCVATPRNRAAPWTRLIVRESFFPADLNLDRKSRLSAVLAWATVCALATGFWRPWLWALAPASLLALGLLNAPLHAFLGLGHVGDARAISLRLHGEDRDGIEPAFHFGEARGDSDSHIQHGTRHGTLRRVDAVQRGGFVALDDCGDVTLDDVARRIAAPTANAGGEEQTCEGGE